MLCPHCQQEIKDGAIKCRHCKSNLQPQQDITHEQILRIPYSKLKIGYVYGSTAAAILVTFLVILSLFDVRGGGLALMGLGLLACVVSLYEYFKTILLNSTFSGFLLTEEGITYIQPELRPRRLIIPYSNIVNYHINESHLSLELRDATGAEEALKERTTSIVDKLQLRSMYTPVFNEETQTIRFDSLAFFDRPKNTIVQIFEEVLNHKLQSESTQIRTNEH